MVQGINQLAIILTDSVIALSVIFVIIYVATLIVRGERGFESFKMSMVAIGVGLAVVVCAQLIVETLISPW